MARKKNYAETAAEKQLERNKKARIDHERSKHDTAAFIFVGIIILIITGLIIQAIDPPKWITISLIIGAVLVTWAQIRKKSEDRFGIRNKKK